MRKYGIPAKLFSFILSLSLFFASCTSTTLIQSTPTGAKLYIDGEPAGTTPYSHSDTKIVGSTTSVKLEKEGYEPFITSFARNEEVDVGAVIGGLFVWIPFLWTMKYKPAHTYELKPVADKQQDPSSVIAAPNTLQMSKAERLRELKALLDDKIITPEEFEAEKKKILESDF